MARGGPGAQEGGGDRRRDAAGGAAERLQGQARPALDATTTTLKYGPVDRRRDMQRPETIFSDDQPPSISLALSYY